MWLEAEGEKYTLLFLFLVGTHYLKHATFQPQVVCSDGDTSLYVEKGYSKESFLPGFSSFPLLSYQLLEFYSVLCLKLSGLLEGTKQPGSWALWMSHLHARISSGLGIRSHQVPPYLSLGRTLYKVCWVIIYPGCQGWGTWVLSLHFQFPWFSGFSWSLGQDRLKKIYSSFGLFVCLKVTS